MTKRHFYIFATLLLICVIGYRGWQTAQMGNTVMENSDPESDMNCVQSGMRFHMKGFLEHWGLPDQEFMPGPDGNSLNAKLIITHYPAGAELLTGLMHIPCGVNNWVCLRILPFVVASIVLVWFVFFLGRILSPAKASVLAFIILITPMVTLNMPMLAFHSYQFYLLLVHMIYLYRYGYLREITWRHAMVAATLISFLQGWFSLDIFFINNLLAIPFMVWLGRPKELKPWLGLTAGAFFGFLVAFAIHFAQVALYRGGWDMAFSDFFQSGIYRVTGIGPLAPEWVDRNNLGLFNVIRRQIDVYVPLPLNFGFAVQIPAVLIVLALCLRKPTTLFTSKNALVRWIPDRQLAKTVGVAFFISLLWAVVMRQHAYIHSFMARHFFIVYFFVLFFGLKQLHYDSLRIKSNTPRN